MSRPIPVLAHAHGTGPRRRRARGLRVLILALLTAVMVASLTGCSSRHVRAMPGRMVAGLAADDMVLMMQRAGYGEDEILDLGPRLRNDLARTGSARIIQGDRTEAIFAVSDGFVHVSSRRRGSFVYDPSTSEVR